MSESYLKGFFNGIKLVLMIVRRYNPIAYNNINIDVGNEVFVCLGKKGVGHE